MNMEMISIVIVVLFIKYFSNYFVLMHFYCNEFFILISLLDLVIVCGFIYTVYLYKYYIYIYIYIYIYNCNVSFSTSVYFISASWQTTFLVLSFSSAILHFSSALFQFPKQKPVNSFSLKITTMISSILNVVYTCTIRMQILSIYACQQLKWIKNFHQSCAKT